MDIPFHQQQLRFIIDLASHRTPLLDDFFRFLNYFDTYYFTLFLIPILWIGISYRWGLRIFYLMVTNILVNGALKILVGWPRPSTDCPAVGLFHFDSGGFPSGAAQTAFLLGGLLIYRFKTKAAWALGLFYILIMSFSRLYLGVHYPIDVLGGWIVGSLLLVSYIRSIDRIEHFFATHGFFHGIALGIGIPLFILWITNGVGVAAQMMLAIGIAAGAVIALRFNLFLPDAKTVKEAIPRIFFAFSSVVIFLGLCPSEYWMAGNFFLSLWITLIAGPLYRTCWGK